MQNFMAMLLSRLSIGHDEPHICWVSPTGIISNPQAEGKRAGGTIDDTKPCLSVLGYICLTQRPAARAIAWSKLKHIPMPGGTIQGARFGQVLPPLWLLPIGKSREAQAANIVRRIFSTRVGESSVTDLLATRTVLNVKTFGLEEQLLI